MMVAEKAKNAFRHVYRGEPIWKILGAIHLALITDAGLIIVALAPAEFAGRFEAKPIYLALFAAYVVCDLIRLPFLRGTTISLGFPVIFLALVINYPDNLLYAALLTSTLGSLISETLRSRLFSRQRQLGFPALRRAFFYAGHHAVACFGALYAYELLSKDLQLNPLLPEIIHVPAILAFVIIYSLLSMLLIWPHDRRIRMFLAPDEEPFVRVDLLTTSMLLPIPASAFYLSTLASGQKEQIFIMVGILPPLFILLFYLSRNYAKMDEERERLALGEKISQRLGAPANMEEMVKQMLELMERLVDYRWAAVYSSTNGNLRLYGWRSHKETVILHDPAEIEEPSVSSGRISIDENQVIWPYLIKSDEGILDLLLKESPQPQFLYDRFEPSTPSDPYLPQKTALIGFPILRDGTQGQEETHARMIGLLVLARPKRRFTTWDWQRGQALTSRAGNQMLSVQRLERAMRELSQQVDEYTRDPEKVRQAMQELLQKNVDVSGILAIISKRSFHDNLQSVLRDLVEGRRGDHISLKPETLAEIYDQVRDETPGMPPLNPHLLQLLQTFTSSLSLAFSFRYQFPDVARGPAFKTFYQLLLVALNANTVPRILALDADIASTVQAVQGRESAAEEVDSFPSAVIEEVEGLQQIVGRLKGYDGTRDTTVQRTSLSQALDLLVEREMSARERLRDPERFVFLQILSSWRGAITNALEEVGRGPARLNVRLRSQRALPLQETTVGLVLENQGVGVASSVVVRLEPSQDYQVLQGEADLGIIAAGKRVEPVFTLRPEGEGPLRLQFHITYNDAERKGKEEVFADQVYLREPPACFEEVSNPYTPGLPLKPGNPTFFGRDDIFGFIQQKMPALMRKMILVLIGERRTGKTSILQQLPKRLNDPRYIPVYIDGQALGIDPGLGNFFLSLATAITDGVDGAGISVPYLTPGDLGESPRHVFERSFLPVVRERIGERTLLLTVDEFEELGERVRRDRLPEAVFPYLRHLIQHEDQLAFIFAGTHKVEELIGDYWSVLFNIAEYRRVGFLKREETIHLITEPVRRYGMVYDDLAIEEILKLTACHPYFTQLLCNILVDRCNEAKRNYVTIQSVRDSVDALLETGRAHLEFLWVTSDWDAQLALATLADLRTRLNQVTAVAIAAQLKKHQIRIDPGSITRVMGQLAARDIVQKISGDPVSYKFTAQLYSDWLRRYQPLSDVVQQVSARQLTSDAVSGRNQSWSQIVQEGHVESATE